jgi:hypothetical protein
MVERLVSCRKYAPDVYGEVAMRVEARLDSLLTLGLAALAHVRDVVLGVPDTAWMWEELGLTDLR